MESSCAFLDINKLITGVNVLKKILFAGFMCLASNCMAFCDQNAIADSVIVQVTNATGSDCVLEKAIATYGHISEPTLLPDAILNGQTLSFTLKPDSEQSSSTLCGYKRKALLLAYSCGENRSAKFLTDVWPFQGMLDVLPRNIRAEKIHLDFKIHNESGRYKNNSPVTVQWTLFGSSL